MKIIISPAKKMICSTDDFLPESTPVFLHKAEHLHQILKKYSKAELKEVLQCNDQLVNLNYERFQTMNLYQNTACALMSYVGLQYQHMGSQLFSLQELKYLQEHLRILSGFYGVLKPMDGIVPYRLEMQAKLKEINLYDYWNCMLYDEITKDDKLILNLASKEYSQAVKPFKQDNAVIVDVEFVTQKDGKLVTKATEAKMARGSMVRFCATHQINEIEQLKSFTEYGYSYQDTLSTDTKLVFLK